MLQWATNYERLWIKQLLLEFKRYIVQYKVPDRIDVLNDPVEKLRWQKLYKDAVTNHWLKHPTTKAMLKSSLNIKWREPLSNIWRQLFGLLQRMIYAYLL